MIEWRYWEEVNHVTLFILYIWVIYLMINKQGHNTITDYLLLLVGLSIGVIIHQNINMRNNIYNKNEKHQMM
jgi:hypothetical protein